MSIQVNSSAGVSVYGNSNKEKPYTLKDLQKLGLYETEISSLFDKRGGNEIIGPNGQTHTTPEYYTLKLPCEINGKEVYTVKQLVGVLNAIRPPKEYDESAVLGDIATTVSSKTEIVCEGSPKFPAMDILAAQNRFLLE